MALSDGDRAILAALEVLRQSIVALPLAIAENAAAGAGAGGGADPPARAARSLSKAGDAAAALAARFGALLGPVAAFGTFLAAPTSGLSAFTGALRLFAASVAPVLLPALFSLSVGLAAASDVIFRKLVPALDGFTRFILQTGIPAVAQFAETAGRATDALKWLADSKAGGMIGTAGTGGGGPFGALNRTLDRLGLGGDHPDRGRSTGESLEASLDDLSRLLPGGSGFVGAKNFAKGLFGFGGGESGLGGTSADTMAATEKARRDTLRELQLSMMPRGSVGGGPASIWARAQQAALGQSPFERRMLEMMTTVTGIVTRASGGVGGTGTLTEDGLFRRMERMFLAARGGRR